MDRGVCVGNKVCARKAEERRHQLHRERIRKIRPVTDTSEPYALQMDHIRTNLKREQMLEDRYLEIDHENRKLLEKMSAISKRTPRTMEQQPGPPSLNRDLRKKELLRITRENQSILKRIQQAQPQYNHIQWESDHRANQKYMQNCAEYPRVKLSARGPTTPSSELVPLQAEEVPAVPIGYHNYHPSGALTERAAPRQPMPAIEAPVEEAVRCVLKDGRRIGETYYLVEMMSDGRSLNICAYNGDTQTTLELAVGEKTHRSLYRELGGDYSLFAQRLRVVERAGVSELTLDDAEAPGASPPPARGPAATQPAGRSDRGAAGKAAEGVRERTAAYMQMQAPAPAASPPPSDGPTSRNPSHRNPSHSPPAAPSQPSAPVSTQAQAQAQAQPQLQPQAPAAPKKSGRPPAGKAKTNEELDADAMVAAGGNLPSRGMDAAGYATGESFFGGSGYNSQFATTVQSAGFPEKPSSAGSVCVCEIDLTSDERPEVHLRGLTPDSPPGGL